MYKKTFYTQFETAVRDCEEFVRYSVYFDQKVVVHNWVD